MPGSSGNRPLEALTDEQLFERIRQERLAGFTRYLTTNSPEQQELYHRRSPKTGTRYCRYCLRPCPKPLNTFCSEQCIQNWKFRSDGGTIRRATYTRDKGVCASCGRDSRKWMEDLRHEYQRIRSKEGSSAKEVQEKVASLCRKEGIIEGDFYRTPWEADHIHPVYQGGGMCGPENIQTLCLRCHRRKGKRQRRQFGR